MLDGGIVRAQGSTAVLEPGEANVGDMERDANVLITSTQDGEFLVARWGQVLGVVRRGADGFTSWPSSPEFPQLGPFARLSEAVGACAEHAEEVLLGEATPVFAAA